MPTNIELHVNGVLRQISTETSRPLLDVLREELDLTGTKYGCGEGECGACTVLIEGVPKRSCITEIGDTAGKHVTTIEGLAQGAKLHPVQEAFLAENAFQCGYCTSGMIVGLAGLLQKTPVPNDDELITRMRGHL